MRGCLIDFTISVDNSWIFQNKALIKNYAFELRKVQFHLLAWDVITNWSVTIFIMRGIQNLKTFSQ